MDFTNLQGKRVVILGLGKNKQGSGTAAAKWAVREGARVFVTDMDKPEIVAHTVAEVQKEYARARKQGKAVFEPEFVLGEHREADILAADLVIQNPGVPFTSPFIVLAEKHGIPVETDISLFFRLCPFPVIGITGTRGKTTTTMLTGAIFKACDKRTALGGNLRISPLEFLDKIRKLKKPAPIVLELSSWQCEGIARIGRSPHVSAITNLSPDHLNRYGTMERYAAAKEYIFAFQHADDIAIINRDVPMTRDMAKRAKARVLWFSAKPFAKEDGTFWRGDSLIFREGGAETAVLSKSDLRIPGEHNAMNALTAVCLAKACGVSNGVIRKAVRAFRGVSDRLETIRTLHGVTWVNDTTATSPEGAIAGLRAFDGKRIVWIGGGTDKALVFPELAAEVEKRAAELIMFTGTATEKIVPLFKKKTPTLVGSMREAIHAAERVAKKGDVVLLSPGAASFGIFLNEFDRGEQFVTLVKKLR